MSMLAPLVGMFLIYNTMTFRCRSAADFGVAHRSHAPRDIYRGLIEFFIIAIIAPASVLLGIFLGKGW